MTPVTRRLLFLILLALPLPAHAQTIPERLGPQFLFGWTSQEQETVIKALRKLEYEHEAQPRGFDNYMMARQRRNIAAIERGYQFYDQNWKLIQPFVFRDAAGEPWGIVAMSLPMEELTGIAVSRDSHCRWQDQDTDDEAGARAFCDDANARAIKMFDEHFAHKRAIIPGGAGW